jgi:hypothetical protein
MAAVHRDLLLKLGKAQVDALFERQDYGPILDDSEFLPLIESVLTAFETVGIESAVVEELWEHAYSRYDRACKEADPNFTTAENKEAHVAKSVLAPKKLLRRNNLRQASTIFAS